MNRRSQLTIGFMTFALVATAATSSSAQSTGPYFALPAWSQTLPASTRFVPVLPVQVCVGTICAQVAQAVLDRETGLVWEKLAGDADENGVVDSNDRADWQAALATCIAKKVGNRFGWRLPTIEELLSLADPTVPGPGVALPSGHPFIGVQASFYSTTTEQLGSASSVNVVNFRAPFGAGWASDKSTPLFIWCVRGGSGRDVQ